MTQSDIERLRALIDADAALEAELFRETDATEFVKKIVRLCTQHDLTVPEGAVWKAIEEGRQAWLATWSP
ncbi:MAG TPA: hypothetical protein VNF68_06405 [Candidatus Baltobacteraceae bacterium]|nr:hypothetical protein [Candidatus Baltobacteraceae bacterium]